MNKIIALAVVLILAASCKEQDAEVTPVAKQDTVVELEYSQAVKPILYEITSTGCPGCGSWGKPTFSAFAKEYGDQIVPVAIHIKYGDIFITPTSQGLGDNRYGSRYTPQIWVNDTNGIVLGGGGIDAQASRNRIHELIATYKKTSMDTIAGTITDITSNSIKFKVGVRLGESSGTGVYYLSCYLLQNSILAEQANSIINPAEQNHVIRQAEKGPWGRKVQLTDGKFEYEGEFGKLDPSDDLELVAILWEKVNNRYEPVGGFELN